MRPFFIWLFSVCVILSAITFYYISSPQNQANISHLIPYSDSATSLLNKIQQEILTPPPLKGSLLGTSGNLTVEGILQQTNQHRSKDEIAALTLNGTLNKAAQAKVADMFAKQYFEHISPDGTGPADLVNNVGYEYVRVGENLALGNFKDDAGLVQAWMDSPGHRENILNKGFSELGIAVGQGQYDGHKTWLAVQTFGLPASACPEPSKTLQNTFTQKKLELTSLSAELDSQKNSFSENETELKQLQAELTQLSNSANAKIKEGNALIKQGNTLVKQGDTEEGTQLQDEGEKLQEEGKVLAQQAQTKQEQLAKVLATQNEQYSAYNLQVANHKKLNEAITALAEQINKQIHQFNSCVESN